MEPNTHLHSQILISWILYVWFLNVFWLLRALWMISLASKASAKTLAHTNISPGYLHNPRVMKHLWFLNFDTQILILMHELLKPI
jgi:uncharacterized membrane protein